jgi:HK97 gp10 family phage protein
MPDAITIKGIPELLRALKERVEVPGQGRVARNMTMAGARVVARHARALAPVETGTLKASIKAKRGRQKLVKGQAIAYANAAVYYSRFVEYGTAHQPARSFLRAALDSNQPEIRAKMIEIGAKGLERELKRQAVAEDPGEA